MIVSFPHSAVLFLRSTRTTPDRMKITIETPGGSVSYDIPARKISDYSIDRIFDNQLYLLIPFYAFHLEKQFPAIERDEKLLEETISLFRDINSRLEALIPEDPNEEAADYGQMDEYTYKTLIEMSKNVLDHVAEKHEKIRKGVGEVLRGQILEYEAKKIRNEGIQIGEDRGIRIGRLQGSVRIYRDELGLDDQTIIRKLSHMYGMPVDQVKSYMQQMEP